MNTFNSILKHSVVVFLVLCLAFVATYVPQSWNDIKRVEAGGVATGGSTWAQQLIDTAIHVKNLATSYASTAYNAITSFASSYLQIKESVLDGIAWALVKTIISQITSSMIRWINSGFKGSPAFVQNLQGFLLSAGDTAFGAYLEELGGPLSALCSPFKLNIRIALQLNYVNARENRRPTCTLTGVLANIEDFMNGTFEQGGWESWFSITSSPEKYTPLGSLLQTQIDASVEILNTKVSEQKLLDFGQGFMSNRICQRVENRENCYISTPGTVISNALTFQLSTGQRSLIAADEVNEIIGALLGQISQRALSGAAGLLGLGGNTGYTAPSGYAAGSVVDQLISIDETQTIDPARLRELIVSGITTEVRYLNAAEDYLISLTSYALDINQAVNRRMLAQEAADNIEFSLLGIINTNLNTLNNILARFDALPTDNTPATQLLRTTLTQDYMNLQGIHTTAQVDSAIYNWEALIN